MNTPREYALIAGTLLLATGATLLALILLGRWDSVRQSKRLVDTAEEFLRYHDNPNP